MRKLLLKKSIGQIEWDGTFSSFGDKKPNVRTWRPKESNQKFVIVRTLDTRFSKKLDF